MGIGRGRQRLGKGEEEEAKNSGRGTYADRLEYRHQPREVGYAVAERVDGRLEEAEGGAEVGDAVGVGGCCLGHCESVCSAKWFAQSAAGSLCFLNAAQCWCGDIVTTHCPEVKSKQ